MAETPYALDRRLSGAPAWIAGLAGGLAILALGVGDWAIGPELSTSVFYVPPIALAAWYGGSSWGMGACVLAAGVWYAADRTQGVAYSAEWIGVWNAGVRLAFFLIVTLLLRRLARRVDEERSFALTDSLTGLANVRHFTASVEAEVARTTRYGGPVTLVYIDLDGFKGVNDRWGHATGDQVLEAVAFTLTGHLRATDVPARLGGDEFAVLLRETDGTQASTVIGKLRTGLEDAMRHAAWPVGFSMGVVTSNGGSLDARGLIRLADDLMYEVKHGGKGSTAFRVETRDPEPVG